MSNERQQRAARAEQMRKEREKADRRQRNLISVAIVAVVVVLIALGGWAIKTTSDDNKDSNELTTPVNANDEYGIEYTTEAATGTAATDPVHVVAYEDFQCPACRSFEAASGDFLTGLVESGEITLEYRPISFLDRASSTKYSSRAANAALCVLDEGGVKEFKAMHDLLYERQPAEGTAGLDDATLIGMAKEAGVDGLDTCIRKKIFGRWIQDATVASREDNVNSTPTVLVDGKVVESPSPDELQKAIDAAKA